MVDRVAVLMWGLELGLKGFIRDTPHDRRAAQSAREFLVLLRDAHFVSSLYRQPVTNLEKPDYVRERVPDLCFTCGPQRFVIEHTTIESFGGQRKWQNASRQPVAIPANADELAECRRNVVRVALNTKMEKLHRHVEEEQAKHGPTFSILLLEFEDYVYSGAGGFLQAVLQVLPEFRALLPDEIHLVGTAYIETEGVRVPTADMMIVVGLQGYRIGDPYPGIFGPVRWLHQERIWFPDFDCRMIRPISGREWR